MALGGTVTVVVPTTRAFIPERIRRTVTFALRAAAVSLWTEPESLPALAPAFSELSVETDTVGAASAGEAARPTSPTVSNDAPAARNLRPSMSETPRARACERPETQCYRSLQARDGVTMRNAPVWRQIHTGAQGPTNCWLRRRGAQREGERLAVRAGAEGVGRPDVLREPDRDRVVADRAGVAQQRQRRGRTA